ncbi:transglycosylase SLT domain-containing protein [Amycolatopsis australiensis]|uniref:Transglycosylase SLT domain-containing protein n=1 Tax=Amycolatopsis australiensis TaxID=546364 RepID=A0A1K1SQ78_9PSEU|nr:transglycosylase SLT domain-containing protein [Amycolatopsis australiensis]SFW86473.1 Transglycosylase SLT domain-containing protein [Amycolatopsis australiensis]
MTARRWRGWVVLVPVLWLAACGGTPSPPAPTPAPATTAPTPAAADPDPARFAPQVLARAREAGVTPWLVMAILYNESYKPHDPQLERAWQQWKPDAAFGVANMHRATFDATKRGRAFAARTWEQLPDDPDLAIEAAAWYLHDLATQLPADHVKGLSSDELLALGYNAGPATMKAFARGARPGPAAQSYLDNLRGNRAKAGHALGEP